ncbi:MAG: prepilin peptidase [Planctomycetaceae bacterium]|nr:prepilin peptidase [Planctomycetaceae bacterium]
MTDLLDSSLLERSSIAAMAWLTVFWFFCLGASFGSLLNVIVYRLPLGLSLWRDSSRCPSCLSPVRSRDNVPIFGWLGLRGRCRDCGWSIPVRYPLVEAAVALQFVGLLLAEVLSGGANLPGRAPDEYTGVVWTIWYARSPELLELYAYHLALGYFAVGAALMVSDGSGLPWSWVACAAAVGLGLPAIDPRVHPLAAINTWGFDNLTWPMRVVGVGDALLGALGGAAVGALLQRFLHADRRTEPAARFAAVCGLYLGIWSTATWCLAWCMFTAALMSLRCCRQASAARCLILGGVLALHVQMIAGRLFWTWFRSVVPWFGWMPA